MIHDVTEKADQAHGDVIAGSFKMGENHVFQYIVNIHGSESHKGMSNPQVLFKVIKNYCIIHGKVLQVRESAEFQIALQALLPFFQPVKS